MTDDRQTSLEKFAVEPIEDKDSTELKDNPRKVDKDRLNKKEVKDNANKHETGGSTFDVPDPDVEKYLESEAGVTIKETTAQTYESRLRIACEYLHDRGSSIRDVDITEIREFLKHCSKIGNRQKTIQCKQSALASLYKYLELYTKVEPNTGWLEIREIDVSNFQTPDRIERKAIDDKEVKRLFDTIDSRRDRLLTILALETGARNGAVRNVKIDHVDLDNQIIKLRDQKGEEWYKMPLSNSLSLEIEHWLNVERDSFTTATNSDYLFPGAYNEKIETNNGFCHIILDAAEEAGIQEVIAESPIPESQRNVLNTSKDVREWKRVTPHVLRHTFNRIMKDSGLNIEQRRDALNHQSTETTEIYDDGGTDYETFVRDILNSF